MNSKNLVIKESGTQLIPWDHICCGLSVQTIGSRFAPKSYLKLCESIGFSQTGNKFNKDIQTNGVIEESFMRSDSQIVAKRNCFQSPLNIEIKKFESILNIDEKHLPKYTTKLTKKDFFIKFIDQKLWNYDKNENIIEEILEQMKNEYFFSIKVSIIDYILMTENMFIETKLNKNSFPNRFNKEKQINSCLNFLCDSTVQQIIQIWDTKYRNINIFDFDLSKTLDIFEFKTKISQNCQKMSLRLKYEWISDCNQILLNNCSKLINYDCIENMRFFDSIASLMSRVFRELITRNLENWINILSDNLEKSFALFKIDIKCKSSANPFMVPPVDKWKDILSYPLTYLLEFNQNIDRVENNLILVKSKILPRKFIFKAQMTDSDVQNLHAQILSILDRIDFHHMIENYEKQFREKILIFINEFENSTENPENILTLFENRRKIILDLIISDNQINVGIFEINFHEFKTYIRKWIEEKINQLVANKLIEIIFLAKQVCHKISSIEQDLGMTIKSCSELMRDMKQFKTIKSKINSLMFDIQYIENNWNFVVENGTKLSIISESDFEVFHRIHCWPQKIKLSFDEKQKTLKTEKSKIEGKLESRIKTFEHQMKNLKNILDNFDKKRISSTFESISDNCRELNDIDNLLIQLTEESENIHHEQKILEGMTTEFPLFNQLIERKGSLDVVWRTTALFQKTKNKYLFESLRTLDLKEMNETIHQLLSSCHQMIKTFKSNDLLQNVNYLKTNIESFKTNYIPLIEVFSSPVLRERHWLKISEIIGQKISWTVNTSFNELISSNNPIKYIKQMTNLGEIASKEYELELLLEKMKNEWVGEWPTDALEIVANKLLDEQNLEFGVRQKCVKAFKWIHLDLMAFFEMIRNQREGNASLNFDVTPPMFIDLILTFKYLLGHKSKELDSKQNKYLFAIERLDSVAKSSKTMRNQMINDFQPILLTSFFETENLMIKIEKETLKIEIQKEAIAADEAIANRSAACAQQIKDECYKELTRAVPAIKSAINALNTLKTEDITLLRSMKCPPLAVRTVLEAVCILNDYKPERKLDPKTNLMVDDYWSSSLRMISDFKFLDKLKNYDKNSIQRNSIDLIRQKYLHCDHFETTALKRVSKACEGMAKWVRAIDIYDRLINVIKPKRERLKLAETELKDVLHRLNHKKSQLTNTTDFLQQLNDEFSVMSEKKKQLENNREKCRSKMARIQHLMNDLTAKKNKFGQKSIEIKKQKDDIVPELVLSAALITYTSASASEQRSGLLNKWQNYLKDECNFTFSKKFSFVYTLGERSEILRWAQTGMPTHQFDIENAIISHYSRRLPIIINKNGVINEWLNRLYPNLMRIDLEIESENNFKRLLFEALERREHLLIENLQQINSNRVIKQLIESNLMDEKQPQLIGEGRDTMTPLSPLSPNFRVFICSQNILDLSPEMLSKISLINWTDSHKTWNDTKDVKNSYISDLKINIEKEKQLIEAENRFMEWLSNETKYLFNENID